MVVSAVVILPGGAKAAHTTPPPPPPGDAAPGSIPYVVAPSAYPSPQAVPGTTGSAEPRLASSLVGRVPTVFLLTATSGTGGRGATLSVQEGTYNGTLEDQILDGKASGLPLSWSSPIAIPQFIAPVSEDALSINGTTLTVAGSQFNETWVVSANITSMNWSLDDIVPGVHPQLATAANATLLTTVTAQGLEATTLEPAGGAVASASLGDVWNATPLLLPSGAETIAATVPSGPSGGPAITFLVSGDGGSSFRSTFVANVAASSSDPIFNSIGQTSLSVPGGTPGELAAVASPRGVLLVYTSSFGGEVRLVSAISSDGGATWNGPFVLPTPLGSIQDPTLELAPSGYAFATWRTNALGSSWELEQTALAMNGQEVEDAQPLAGSSGAGAPSMTMDPFERVLVAWSTGTGNLSSIEMTGAFVAPVPAWSLLDAEVSGLPLADYPGLNSSVERSSLLAALNSTGSALRGGDGWGGLHSFAQNVYPHLSELPLLVNCSSSGKGHEGGCPGLKEGSGPVWLLNESGPDGLTELLAFLSYWLFEAVGVSVVSPFVGDPGTLVFETETFLDASTVSLSLTYPPGINPRAWEHTWVNSTTCGRFPVHYGTNTTESYWQVTSVESDFWLTQYGGLGARTSTNSTSFGFNVEVSNMETGAMYTHWNDSVTYSITHFLTWSYSCGGKTKTGTIPVATWEYLPPSLFSGAVVPPSLAMSPSSPALDALTPGGSASRGSHLSAHWNNTGLTAANQGGPPCLFGPGPFHCEIACFFCAETDPQVTDVTTGDVQGPVNFDDPTNLSSYTASKDFYYNQTVSPGDNVAVSGEEISLPGGFLAAPGALSAGGASNPRPIVVSYACSFPVQFASTVWGLHFSALTSSSATVTWYSGPFENGQVLISPGGSVVTSSTATPVQGSTNGTLFHAYQLGGLNPFTAYTVTVTDPFTDYDHCGGVTYSGWDTSSFLTAPKFVLAEQDLPYDSITQEGGGATLSWSLSSSIAQDLAFASGYLTYSNATSTGQVPLTALPPTPPSAPYFYETNLTALGLGSTYVATLTLNLTGSEGNVTTSASTKFTYLKDTSGDGLTDAEKVYGWTVTSTNLQGTPSALVYSADPILFATNGLVSDLLEKKFGLNPNTLDSAGSGMLDTWSLAFDLTGRWGVGLTEHFNTYNLTGASTRSFASYNATGVRDDSPYDAQVLWGPTQLDHLESLAGSEDTVHLRALIEEGTVGSTTYPVLVVSGKLSYGADPLAASTFGDGIADGARVDPLGPVYLQVAPVAWSVSPHSGSILQAGMGVSAYLQAESITSGGTSEPMYGGFMPTTTADSSGDAITGVSFNAVSLPVDDLAPTVNINATLVANIGSSGSPNYFTVVASPVETDNIVADVENGFPTASHSYRTAGGLTWSQGGSTDFVYFTFAWRVVPPQLKAQTLLWVPSDNSTLSNLPVGLQRYTGEQDFDLLVVNDTIPADNGRSTVFENAVPSPFGTAYGVELFPGLNNILVPRGAFLSSPLGQALLNDSAVNPAVLRGPLTFTPTNWENAVNQNVTSPGTPGYVNVVSSLDMSCGSGPASACQGLASNPNLEPASDQSRQVQAIITFNISTQAQLDDLLGGLLLNASGNLTGSLLNESAELPTLGFSQNLLTALANRVLPNIGAWGAPTSTYTPPPPPKPWYEVAASLIVNAVSGVVHLVTGILSVAWNAAVAAGAYLAKEALAAATVLGITALAAQFVHVLKAVAAAMEQALKALELAILAAVRSLLSPLISPIVSAAKTLLLQTFDGYQKDPPPDAGSAEFNQGFAPLIGLSIALGVAAVVALSVLAPEEAVLGPVASIVLTIVATSLGLALLGPNLGSLGISTGSLLDQATGLTQSTLAAAGANPCVFSGGFTALGVIKFLLLLGVIGALIFALSAETISGLSFYPAFILAILGLVLVFSAAAVGPISLGFVTFSVTLSTIISLIAVLAIIIPLAVRAVRLASILPGELLLIAGTGLLGAAILGADIAQSGAC